MSNITPRPGRDQGKWPLSPSDDRLECRDRAQTVLSVLERCSAELARLECVPNLTAGEVNAIGAARGFVDRASLALEAAFCGAPSDE